MEIDGMIYGIEEYRVVDLGYHPQYTTLTYKGSLSPDRRICIRKYNGEYEAGIFLDGGWEEISKEDIPTIVAVAFPHQIASVYYDD